MIYDPRPLSIAERIEIAKELRAAAAKQIAEAERIEAGVKSDNDVMMAAILLFADKINGNN